MSDLPMFIAVQSPHGDLVHAYTRTLAVEARLALIDRPNVSVALGTRALCGTVRNVRANYHKVRDEWDFTKHTDQPRPGYDGRTVHTVCQRCAGRVRRILTNMQEETDT